MRIVLNTISDAKAIMSKRSPLYVAIVLAFAGSSVYAQTISAPSAGTLDTITVSGSGSVSNETPEVYAGGQVARGGQAGILGNIDMMDMPFTQTSYTSKLIQDQQARTLGDVLKNDASVQVGNGFGNQAETFVIRGFTLNNDDLSFNGLYGILPRQVLPVEMIERVEVFKGASAFLNGAAPGGTGLGGIINIQPKRAGDEPLTRLNVDYSGRANLGGGVDIGRRWGANNEFGIRVNAAHHDGETYIDDADMRSTVGVIGLDFRGEKTRMSLDAGYQKVRFDHPRPTIRLLGDVAVPEAPSNNINYGQPWAFSEMESTFAVARVEYDVNRDWTTYGAVGVSRDEEYGAYSSPTVDSSGVGTSSMLYVPFQRDSFTGEVGIRGEFDTGPVGHRVNLAYSAMNKKERSASEYVEVAGAANLYEEIYVDRPTGSAFGDLDDPNVTKRVQLRSVAISDTLSLFDDNVLLTLGMRNQSIVDLTYDAGTAQMFGPRYDESVTTPILGLVLRPWESVSLYANRIEGLTAGESAPDTAANPNETLAPFRTKQTEAGIKVDMGSYGGSFGVFQIEKPDAYLNPITNVFGLAGEQRNRGIELNAYGEPVPGWRVLGGITLMNPRLSDTEAGINDDNYAAGVPRFQGVVSTELDVSAVPGLTLQASLQHRGSQYTTASNAHKVGSWTRVDLGAVYRTKVQGRNVTYRAGIDNVADRRYWSSVAPQFGQITQGRGRTAKLSMSVDF